MSSYGFITSNYLWVLNRCNETQRLKALNLLATASNLGFGISSIFIGLVVTIGFQYIFLFSGIALFILSYISSKDKKTSPHIQNENETLNQSSKPLNFNGNKDRIILTIILICVFFTGTIVAQLSSTYSIYIQSSFPHLGITAVSILFTLNSLLVVLFEVPIGNILSNYNKILMVGIGSFFIGLGMFLLNVSFIFSIAILACIIYTLGEIIFFCLAQLICYQRGPKNKKGKYMGLYRMVYASSRVIGPAIGGIIYSDFGGNIIWYISGLIGITSLLTCFHFRKFD
jgi:predicted MFS family arabinose efflux permease